MFKLLAESCFSDLIGKAVVFNTDVICLSGLDSTLETCIRHMNISTDINELIKSNGNNCNEIATSVFV